MVAHDAGGLKHGVGGAHAAIGPDVEHELVELSHLTHTGVVHSVLHAGHGGEDGVNRNHADGAVLVVVVVGGVETTAHAHFEIAVEDGALVKVADNLILVHHGVDVVVLDVTGGHHALLRHAKGKGAGLLAEVLELDLLEVEDDFGHVLHHAGQRGELVLGTGDTHAGDGSTLQGAEQHAAQGVAKGVTETGLDRLGDEGHVVGILRVSDALKRVRNLEMGQLDGPLLLNDFVRHISVFLWPGFPPCGLCFLRKGRTNDRIF